MKRDQNQPEDYLESGTNELKILEYSVGGLQFGINVLKVSRVLTVPDDLTQVPMSHPSILGVMDNLGVTVPIIGLQHFLNIDGGEDDFTDSSAPKKEEIFHEASGEILVTEFFGDMHGFQVSNVDFIHTILWEQVFDPPELMKRLGGEYIIGVIYPTKERNIMLLDYERIILELTPELAGDAHEVLDTSMLEGQNRKILVAEDSTSVRNLLAAEFKDAGFDILVAKDGKLAWEIFQSTPGIELVISDVEMPQMDGLNLTKRIKEQNPKLPVILYSSIGDIGMKARAKDVKADAHVTKLSMQELFDTTNSFLRKIKDRKRLDKIQG